MADEELEWPEILEEVEPKSDLERLYETRYLDTTFKGEAEFTLEPGTRIKVFCEEIDLEVDGEGLASLFVNDTLAWCGPSGELEHLASLRDKRSGELVGVCVNKRIVWVRS